jgi:hypothetical protein
VIVDQLSFQKCNIPVKQLFYWYLYMNYVERVQTS